MIVRPRRQYTSTTRTSGARQPEPPTVLQDLPPVQIDSTPVTDPHELAIQGTQALDQAHAQHAQHLTTATTTTTTDERGESPTSDSDGTDRRVGGGNGDDDSSNTIVGVAYATGGSVVETVEAIDGYYSFSDALADQNPGYRGLTDQEIDGLKRPELVQELKARGLNAGGTKADMAQRLKDAIASEKELHHSQDTEKGLGQ